MKVYEIKKGVEAESRGQVMMGIDATPEQMKKICEHMDQEFDNCDYEEDAEKQGEVSQCWIVSRCDVSYFRAEFKKIKQQIK